MNVRSGIALGLGFAILTCGSPALADTTFVAECVCPLCKTEFKAVLAGSGTIFNRRLDLRPVGAIRSPWPVPVCTKCRFAMYKELNEKYSDDELKKLRGFVNSDAYRKLDPKIVSFERIARLYEFLGRAPDEIAHVYLEASWQAEDKKDAEMNRALLEKSREWLEKHLASSPEKDEKWRTQEFLRGELLRRLGKFDEAKKQFDRLGTIVAFQEDPFPHLIAQERSLIKGKDASPKEIVREAKGEPAARPSKKAA